MAKLVSAVSIALVAVATVLISVFLANRISKPVIIASSHLNALAEADFTKDLPEIRSRKNDEIGSLMKSVNIMSRSIRNLINDVVEESSNVENNILASAENLQNYRKGSVK